MGKVGPSSSTGAMVDLGGGTAEEKRERKRERERERERERGRRRERMRERRRERRRTTSIRMQAT